MIKILITPGGYLSQSKKSPVVGKTYYLEDVTTGSNAQNKAWHSLLNEYWKTGMHSYDVKTFKDFRDHIKRDLGAGFERFVYIDENGHMVDAKTYDDVPEWVKQHPERRQICRGVLKSWSEYTLKQRRESIDNLIAEMEQAGVNTAKYQEIMKGLHESSKTEN